MATHSFIEVLFDVPGDVLKGLASGDMVRRGGVIQWAKGAERGEVVTWLKESGALARSLEMPPRATQQLASLQLATNVLAVGQVVTLGFSVLSFAVVNHKLNVIGRKVDSVLAGIAALKEEVAWLDRRQDLALEARMRGAFDQGEWALTSGRLEGLVAVRGTLVDVEHHYRGLLVAMLEQQRAHRLADVFSAYQAYLALAGMARVRCEAALDGIARGIDALVEVHSGLKEAEQAFRAPLRNIGDHLHLLRLGSSAERLLRPSLDAMTETANRIEGYQSELRYCSEHSITLGEWDELGGAETEPRVLLLVPTKPQA